MNIDKQDAPHTDERKAVIMAVDDDANNLAVVRDCLTGYNYTVLMAEDGESAVSRADYAKPDLILLDIMMTGIDGYETYRQLKLQKNTRDIPVIFMSALSDTGHKVHALEAGAVDYITKPFQQEELLARVGVHLSIRDLNRRLKEANELLEERVEERTMDLHIANLELEEEIAERQAAQEQLQEQAAILEEKIEELQTTHEALRVSEEQLRQAQKMEAVGTMAGGIAHDFNNILTAIMGFGSILRTKLGDSPHSHYADDILSAADKAAKLTHGLLAFSRKQPMEAKPVNINEVVATIDKILHRIIGEDIEYHSMTAPEDLVVMGDSGQIEQVLMNLAVNARDAMPGGGTLRIKTERIEITPDQADDSPRPGLFARITVTDTGTGIDKETCQRIFEPFFTTKELGKGTGLGLSIVYGIIKQHGGDVTVCSEPGAGTCFTIYLPLVASSAKHVEVKITMQTVGGTESILVAEDDECVRSFMVQALEEFGYQVTEAVNGEDALKKYRAESDRFQLVILDAVMPKLNGRIVYDAIRKEGKQVKVLFSSGYTSDVIEENVMREAGVSFMNKPVTLQILLNKVREALDKTESD